MTGNLTPYDELLYPGHAYDTTHPARLATVAALYGMTPQPVSRCRVLELGCGYGRNLIPMGYQYPESSFLGIDLSARSIEQGIREVAELGLSNVELRHADIATVGASDGEFDYIIAHGVYSWVPPEIREKMMSIFAENLRPNGIVYVSYNSHPGSHLRDLARDMMLFHVRDITDPQTRVVQARAILKFIAESTPESSVHGAVMRDQLKRVEKMGDEVLFHDDLNPIAVPFLLHQVVTDAQRHGLQYLGDATLARRDLQRYPEATRAVLAQFPDDYFMPRDQYQDFLDGYGFRRTLLCRADVELRRKLEPDCIRRFHLASSAVPADGPVDLNVSGVVQFKSEEGASLTTDNRMMKAAVQYLGQRWPSAVAFDELESHVLEAVATASSPSADRDEMTALASALFHAACAGHIELHLFRPTLTTAVSERPKASLLARTQVKTARFVTNLRHGTVQLEDDIVRRFLQLVDGTRTIDQLVIELQAIVDEMAAGQRSNQTADGQSRSERLVVSRADVERNVKFLASLALLVA